MPANFLIELILKRGFRGALLNALELPNVDFKMFTIFCNMSNFFSRSSFLYQVYKKFKYFFGGDFNIYTENFFILL